jgi:Conjugal transfer protein TraD
MGRGPTRAHPPSHRAGLVELADDDRATLYGALLELAAKAREDGNALSLWKRRGKRAFDAEADDG